LLVEMLLTPREVVKGFLAERPLSVALPVVSWRGGGGGLGC
jgi:hypothetical protein